MPTELRPSRPNGAGRPGSALPAGRSKTLLRASLKANVAGNIDRLGDLSRPGFWGTADVPEVSVISGSKKLCAGHKAAMRGCGLGGPDVVSNAVETALAQAGVSVLRVAGKDYTDTARELARFEVAASTGGLGWASGHRVLVARGNGFTDGLAGAVLENAHNTTTGAGPHPLLLTESPTAAGSDLTTFLEVTGHSGIDGTTAKTIGALTVLGGSLALTTALVASIQTDLGH